MTSQNDDYERISNWVHVETVDDAGPPLVIENGRPPVENRHLWREATDDEYRRYVDYYNALEDSR